MQKALQSISRRGIVQRLARGLHYDPPKHPKLGDLTPNPDQNAQALVGKGALRIQRPGAYAANRLGLHGFA